MTSREALCALFFAILVATSGFAWLFGPYGLIGGAVALAALTLFTDTREDGDG